MAKFHLGWFLGNGFGVQGWNQPGEGRGYDWKKPQLYQDCVRALERGFFDMLIIEDSSMVPDIYEGSSRVYLEHAMFAPKHDPVPLVPLLAAVTSKIGIVPTLTTTFYPPFLLARLMATLDHLTEGRVGWNIVTSTSHRSAQNYGFDWLPQHDTRYDMADEFVELVCQLWQSWEPGSVVMDRQAGVFADHTKVHRVDFEGKWYKSRGPLNVVPSPQGRPVFVQAGGSRRGRQFAATHAETIIASVHSVDEMKQYRDEVRSLMVSAGRDPDTCKVLFACAPMLAETREEAAAKKARIEKAAPVRAELALAALSNLTHIDFSTFELDEPLPDLETNGSQSTLAEFTKGNEELTLREIALKRAGSMGVPFVGTAEDVADQMGETMDEVGGDGFLVAGSLRPRYIAELVDDLVPALQRRGCMRTEYPYDTFRANLMEF